MKEVALAVFCAKKKQAEAASILGCSQVAVSQMLKAEREIVIVFNDDGSKSWYEIRRPKNPQSAA